MNGKKTASIVVALILVASLAAAISIWIFFQTYEPKTKKIESHESSAATIEVLTEFIH